MRKLLGEIFGLQAGITWRYLSAILTVQTCFGRLRFIPSRPPHQSSHHSLYSFPLSNIQTLQKTFRRLKSPTNTSCVVPAGTQKTSQLLVFLLLLSLCGVILTTVDCGVVFFIVWRENLTAMKAHGVKFSKLDRVDPTKKPGVAHPHQNPMKATLSCTCVDQWQHI